MPNRLELIGRRFGRLLVIAQAPTKKFTMWECLCDCGGRTVTRGAELTSGNCRSCGCLKRGNLSRGHLTHGMSKSPLYAVWSSMRERCLNPRSKSWKDYGGRGIAVCDEWRRDFPAFAAHVGERPDGYWLERINNDGNYEPGNVRWATPLEQAANRRHRICALTPEQISERGRRAAAGKGLLTSEDVCEIRSHPAGRGVGAALARKHGVSKASISMIRNGKMWAREGPSIHRKTG